MARFREPPAGPTALCKRLQHPHIALYSRIARKGLRKRRSAGFRPLHATGDFCIKALRSNDFAKCNLCGTSVAL